MKIKILTLLLPFAALAAVQGPDAGGYSATDAAVFSFIDISGGGGGASILSGTDDGTVNVTMPFSFQFYGTGYTNVCVSSNGAVYFLSDPTMCAGINDFANTDLSTGAPSVDQAALFPLWSDLTFQSPGAGSVFYQTLGTAPNRRFIIQWNNAYPQGSANPVTFQVILNETTNTFSFQYQTVSIGGGDPANNGGAATIGIRNAGSQTTGQQLQWSFDSAVLANGVVLAFSKGAGPLPPVLTAPSNGATSVGAPVTLIWAPSAGATSYDVYFGTTNPPPLIGNVTGTSTMPSVSYSTGYNWQVVAKNGAGTGASAIWSFTTTAAPPPSGGGGGGTPVGNPLTALPGALTLTTAVKGAVSKQTVRLSYQTYTAGAPTYTSNTTTNQGLGWLSVTPSSGTMTLASSAGFLYTYIADVAIVVDPTGIAAGASYSGNVNVTAAGGVASIPVTMNVLAQPTVISLSQPSLNFVYRKGDPNPVTQSLALSTKTSGTAFGVSASTTTGGNWLAATPASGNVPGSVSVSVDATVLSGLDPGAYSGTLIVSGTNALNVSVPVSLIVVSTTGPLVMPNGVVPIYSTSTTVQPGSWISIYGTKLAPAMAVWNGDFPTKLGNVSVTINGKPAYLWLVSPTQINLQAPDDTATGVVNVVVTTPSGTFTATVTLGPASPSLSLLSDAKHVAAQTVNPDGTYAVIGPVGAFSYPTRPIAAGETLVLYGVGFGPTNPPVKAGVAVTNPAPTVNPVTVTIGGVNAQVVYSGIAGAGLYQVNAIVPKGTGSGDQPVVASVNGLQTMTGPVVTIK